MADLVVVRALRDNFNEAEIRVAYASAFQAHLARSTEVTITAASFAEGNSSGQIAGDPKEILESCQAALDQIAAEGSTAIAASGPYHTDHSRRYVRT
jgi:hypothetical protein